MNKTKFLRYECSLCGKHYAPEEMLYTCPQDDGNLDIVLDYGRLSKELNPDLILSSTEFSVWRYTALLPVADPGFKHTPLHQVGWTPVYQPQKLATELGLHKLFVKDESRNPSASFKDRASAIVMARAHEIDANVIVAASTGNAGAATACMAAAMGKKSIIFAPRTAPEAKVAQLTLYGAQVILVNGNYDKAFELSIAATQEFGWYNRNTGFNPFTVEGKKTAAFEIWEQVLRSQPQDSPPLCIFVSVGDGNIISGLYKGFKDLLEIGWINKMPRLFGVQANGSAAIANAFQLGSNEVKPVHAETIADSISVDLPRDGFRALRTVRNTKGSYVTVSDDAILQAMTNLGKVGIFAEPAGAAAYAGLIQARQQNLISTEDPVLVINTGSGLKDVKAAQKAAPPPMLIEPTIQSLKDALR